MYSIQYQVEYEGRSGIIATPPPLRTTVKINTNDVAIFLTNSMGKVKLITVHREEKNGKTESRKTFALGADFL